MRWTSVADYGKTDAMVAKGLTENGEVWMWFL